MIISPLKIDDEFLVTIKRIGINGEGIGYYKRQAVFIPGALVDEEVVAKCTKVAKNYAEAQLIRVKKKSSHRVKPACELYGKCGGCQLQHMSYEEQLAVKRSILIHAVERYANMPLPVLEKITFPTFGMKNPYNYRNKASMPVSQDDEGLLVGLFELNSRRLIPVENCPIHYDGVNHVIRHAVDLLDDFRVYPYNAKSKKGTVRHLVVRQSKTSKEVQVTFVMANDSFPKMDALARELMQACKDVKSVFMSINASDDHEIFGQTAKLIRGKETISDNLGPLKFNLSAKSFYQLNSEQTHVLYQEVKKAAKVTKNESVIDAYCGVGTIGQFLAPAAYEVRGVDTNEDAIEDARKNAKLNNLDNVSYDVGDAGVIVPKWIKSGFKPHVMIVDPPRSGLDTKMIQLILNVRPKTLIYVSCNPSTLAKTLSKLRGQYKIDYMQPVDMFPQTANVEAVVRLIRK
ncbi:MAG: 23S rRNA (uracil(1939)-C(5))-methyltransferase RlmD [Defluviitaleaceae bacterium]|nr:23S rRNA (uracil(1939)-C(5))-methyltransferase RlmD [Defluviitaleaceae bacterium]